MSGARDSVSLASPATGSNEPEEAPWALSAEAISDAYRTTPAGLTSGEARARLESWGPNRVPAGEHARALRIGLHQFKSPLIYILLAAMAISLAIAHWEDAIVISVVLVLNATIGFVQEYRAENAIAALMGMVSTRATVLRDGERTDVDGEEVVPGDVVLLESGDVVPADLRLLEATHLECDEAMLTGESVPVGKVEEPIQHDGPLPASDWRNMALAGASVTSGRGRGIVVAIGATTRVGQIAETIRATERVDTPLQRRMTRLGGWLAGAVVALSAVAFVAGLSREEPVSQMFLTAVAIAVAAIPEGLPVVMTIALAVSVRRMANRRAIVRRLPAVETLGSCTVIVTDKTGTLTENQMTARAVSVGERRFSVTGGGLDSEGTLELDGQRADVDPDSRLFLTLAAGVLCNEADLHRRTHDGGTYAPRGDPTEVALLVLGAKAGLNREALLTRYEQTAHVPFEPAQRFAATIHRERDSAEPIVFAKGAPEQILSMCDRSLGRNGDDALDAGRVLRETAELAAQGLRVLAMAVGLDEAAAASIHTDTPKGLAFLGLVGMLDPPREGAREAIEACHRAGITVKMVTGDHAATARAIAAMLGLAAEHDRVVDGPELVRMSDADLRRSLVDVAIFARVSPADKLRIVGALREEGHVVAVTGDGVNDAPALKAADVGAAMGKSGTDVAKEASEIVLTDDHFATIGAAVEEGRFAFANIRKATVFLVSSGAGELLAILGSLLLGLRLPFLPAQILWLNVVTNGVGHVALAVEPGEPDEFRRGPRDPREAILTPRLVERMVTAGLTMAAGTLGMFLFEGGAAEETLGYAQVTALTTMVVFQAIHIGNCRSDRRSAFALNPFSNRLLLLGVSVSLLLHIGSMHFGPTQHLIKLQPLALETWMRITLLSLSIVLVMELHKLIRPIA